jgi:hypothetical protein
MAVQRLRLPIPRSAALLRKAETGRAAPCAEASVPNLLAADYNLVRVCIQKQRAAQKELDVWSGAKPNTDGGSRAIL